MHFTHFIMHKYRHAYSLPCCMHRVGKAKVFIHHCDINSTEIHTTETHTYSGDTGSHLQEHQVCSWGMSIFICSVRASICLCVCIEFRQKEEKKTRTAKIKRKQKCDTNLASPSSLSAIMKKFTGYKFTNTKHHRLE